MSDTVIKVENLSKRYVIGSQRQERYVILSNNVQDFQCFCDRVGQKAQDNGLTEEKLLEILTDVQNVT